MVTQEEVQIQIEVQENTEDETSEGGQSDNFEDKENIDLDEITSVEESTPE